MKIKALEHWKGAVAILVAAGGPWSTWATSGAQVDLIAMLGVVIPSIMCALGALQNLLDDSITAARLRKAEKAGKSETPKDPTE